MQLWPALKIAPSSPRRRSGEERRVLVFCANLHTGGGVAVATSLIHEFSVLEQHAHRLTVLASSEVSSNLKEIGTRTSNLSDFHTLDVWGTRALMTKKPVRFPDFDVVFTVFGPSYTAVTGPRNIVGFAQPWVAYPRNSAYGLLPVGQRVRTRAKYGVQGALFAAADVLVVEHEHVRKALRQQRRFRGTRIEVVPNVVDSVILDQTRWHPVSLPPREGKLRLGVASYNYPHKNLEILPKVQDLLISAHGLDVEFLVTLPESTYSACTDEFRSKMRNVGSLQLAQSAAFNAQLDGVVFPTLLECFSATPIEALATRTPLFASDRPFVRDTVGAHGVFFDPRDPADIARSIATYFQRPLEERNRDLDAAYDYVAKGGYTSRDRALAMMRLMDEDR